MALEEEQDGSLEKSKDIFFIEDNEENKILQIKIIENQELEVSHNMSVIQKHPVHGNIAVLNPSERDKIWDIKVQLANYENTDLESGVFEIGEIPPKNFDKENLTSEQGFIINEYEVREEKKQVLSVKEYITTLEEFEEINDINASDDKIQTDNDIIIPSTRYNESFSITRNAQSPVNFAVVVENISTAPIREILIVKEIPSKITLLEEFMEINVGSIETKGDQLRWIIKDLPENEIGIFKFRSMIKTEENINQPTGNITVEYNLESQDIARYSGISIKSGRNSTY